MDSHQWSELWALLTPFEQPKGKPVSDACLVGGLCPCGDEHHFHSQLLAGLPTWLAHFFRGLFEFVNSNI